MRIHFKAWRLKRRLISKFLRSAGHPLPARRLATSWPGGDARRSIEIAKSLLLANAGSQLLDYLQSGFVGGFGLGGFEGDGSYAGVAAASVTLADSG